jgi:electron transport complex protein RnfG
VNSMLKSALALGMVALAGTALLTAIDWLTADRIAEQEKRVVREQLGQILPQGYDNELLDDRFTLVDETHFPNGQQVTVWRARKEGNPLAAILKFDAVNGYNGDITLLAGINMDGSLRGVRVLAHKETPGLGDAIETAKSDWILGFSGKSLGNPDTEKWTVKREGGQFDQFTGATITPRAVVEAVRLALLYFESHRALLFETPPSPDEDNLR